MTGIYFVSSDPNGMGIRHLARQRVLQLLYALEFAPPADDFSTGERLFLRGDTRRRKGWGPFASELAETVYRQRKELDDDIRPLLHNWTMDRLPMIDRLCLRLALCELKNFPDIPMRVTLNEYIEIVRLFSTDESPQYINAVLDRLAQKYPKKDFLIQPDAKKDSDPSPANPIKPDTPVHS